ncbi:3-isopropylmalate dehydratase small subunit [Erythrobacter sp. QSSC1-22B]|uniref:3-isopropylmalate dehydratase small subunit n=1 Tax=Erythrobacter sp. QSSC1-22B TaxID=1860125 RepID=UPI000805BC69|nr:3-isopropylmalate dehydratase small subunit [Erythrobacter sp. QSSC1-22B]OBX17833.1 3-isopropylmalate dehydratase small subunit [Erythrobacter sp. QSSC1-22B]
MNAPFPQPLTSIAAPLIVDNVDTDTIIPSREIRSTGREGLADGLFAPWRYSDADLRTENPDFVLNRSEHRGASILLGGANFGCGSSREHAVWALREWGIRCVIAESFAPIFHGNCIRNGIVPIALGRADVESLANARVMVDLKAREVNALDMVLPFTLDTEAHLMLTHGLDAIDLTMTQAEAIEGWLATDRIARPWIYLVAAISPRGAGL